jgi:putative copper export protein
MPAVAQAAKPRVTVSPYYINVTVHVLAALFWLGGMSFLALVGAPVLRNVEPDDLRASLFRQLGERFRVAGWIALAVLIVTGVLNLHLRGLLSFATLGSAMFWNTSYGVALAWKLGAVAAMLFVQLLHDFWIGPKASRATPGSVRMRVMRKQAALLARVSALIGLVIVIAAVRLARGG